MPPYAVAMPFGLPSLSWEPTIHVGVGTISVLAPREHFVAWPPSWGSRCRPFYQGVRSTVAVAWQDKRPRLTSCEPGAHSGLQLDRLHLGHEPAVFVGQEGGYAEDNVGKADDCRSR
jgi:hypothetical protein